MPVAYQIKRSKRRVASASITVGPKGVTVHAPFWMPSPMIQRFVEERRDWIEHQLQKFKAFVRPDKRYDDGEKVQYLGEEYVLKITPASVPGRTRITLEDKIIQISVSPVFEGEKRHEEVKKTLTRWYMEHGVALITEKANYFADKLQVEYSRINLKNVSSIWGSCSVKNNLNFNRNLILAPIPVIEYVIIHELCHIVHRDHSSRFWGLVRTLDPDYKTHRRWLRENRLLLEI